jgi:hypothetical protein
MQVESTGQEISPSSQVVSEILDALRCTYYCSMNLVLAYTCTRRPFTIDEVHDDYKAHEGFRDFPVR